MTHKYRWEIDGLRAIAIGFIILYNAQITVFGHQPFKGGFIGIDIFKDCENSKLFLKDCLINVISHLLTQSKVALGSEEALEIVGCIKCFIYIASSEISEANYRCLGLYAEILYPKHALYDCLHGDIGTNELNIQTKNFDLSYLRSIYIKFQ